jgi:c-di-GMP-related signal transduction protein
VDLNGIVSYELYNFNKDLVEKKYNIMAMNADYNIMTNQLIINGYDWLTLIKPTFTDVSNTNTLTDNLKIYYQGNKIILELSTNQTGNSQLFISDLNGKNIYQQDLGFINQENNKYFIDIELPSGIYLCKVIVGPKVYSQKFEIVR